MEEEVECPSGLSGKIRALKVKDESLTKDVKLIKSGKLVYEMCKRCWIGVDSPGPYEGHIQNGHPNWGKIMQGDAFWVFLQIRRVTWGDEYDFTTACDNCSKAFSWTMLFSELKKKAPTQEGLDSWRTGTPIDLTTEAGLSLTCRMLSNEDDSAIQKLVDGRKLSNDNASLIVRLVTVEGVDFDKPFAKVRWVEELSSGEADEILDLMEEHDCGADTEIEVTCEHCYYDQQVTLPLGPGFFRRQKRKKTKTATPSIQDGPG